MDKILSPFIFLIRTIFEIGYTLTGSYGVSILLLSFAISLLLFPIFIYIEKVKKRDDVIKKRMQSLIDEIKLVYTGQERHYYLKTLNRQFGYSQLKALIPILSLLVQIPFFIAAYQYLETLEVLNGVSFGPLSDLSQPDHLFGIVNVLPVVMTVVNLLTAYFYTRNGNTSERKQMVVIAGVFLVLLFKLPSGLVLYWTMNNVFAFLRMFITNKEVFEGRYAFTLGMKRTLLYVLSFLVSILFITQINWAIDHSYRTLPVRLLLSAIASFILVSVLAFIWKDYRDKFIPIFKQTKHIYLRGIHAALPLSVIVNIVGYTVFDNDNFLNNTLIFTGACVVLILLYQLLLLPVRTIKHSLQNLFIPKQILIILFVTGLYFYVSYKYHLDADKSPLINASLIAVVIAQVLFTIFPYNRKSDIKLLPNFMRFVIKY